MKTPTENGFDFGSIGIIIGIVVVVLTVLAMIWHALTNREDGSSDLTWVG